MIPMEWDPETDITIAAHAVVQMPDSYMEVEAQLPDQALISISYPGAHSYFDTDVLTPGFLFGSCARVYENII